MRKLVGEEPRIKRSKLRTLLYCGLIVLVLAPFTIYVLTESNQIFNEKNQLTPMAQLSIIAIAPVLGGLVLTAASNFKRYSEKRLGLISVAKKLISSTVLLIFFVIFMFTVNRLHGIDPYSFQWNDLVAWFRGIYFWLAIPCVYGSIILFLFGIMDLVYVLADIDTNVIKSKNNYQNKSDASKSPSLTTSSKIISKVKTQRRSRGSVL